MFSSIPSKLTSATPLASPLALSQTRNPGVKSIPVFGEEATAASATRSVRIPERQNSASAKSLAVPDHSKLAHSTGTPTAKDKAQTLAAKSLTNKTLATNASATAKPTTAALLSKAGVVKSGSAKAAAGEGDKVTTPPIDPSEAVRLALTELGYDTGQFKFEAHEEFVSYPGGGYTHRFTTVQLPNGLKENFSTDLMARYPTVTANELRRLLENRYQTS